MMDSLTRVDWNDLWLCQSKTPFACLLVSLLDFGLCREPLLDEEIKRGSHDLALWSSVMSDTEVSQVTGP
jgi:hypothetical protein